jgi:putative selenium-dependent molybdenum hydroxylase maturation system YqeC-like protein
VDGELSRLLLDRVLLRPRELIAFVGAGGKTTLMLSLGAALEDAGRDVVMTTTTRVGAEQVPPGFWFERRSGRKLVGPPPEEVDARFAREDADYVLVEADGAGGRAVKAPAAHEPVIPAGTTLVIAVIAADALDRRIEAVAHRPELVAEVAGCRVTDLLSLDRAARLIRSDRGLRKRVPPAARFAVALTRVGPGDAAADRLRALLTRETILVVSLPFRATRTEPGRVPAISR